ncbi:MAG: mitochondrial fission ELM1 family protein [Planctomycetaceae bacterium]|nr:mitochondrial fission ELM1 family protein [Planctomycetaceae bacterium]
MNPIQINDPSGIVPCWCLSKGMAGMISQMTGLAQAVGLPYECKSTRLGFPWRWVPMPLIPRSPGSLSDPGLIATDEPPQLILSCGRHGVIPALALKRRFGSRTLTVQIQDPKVDPSLFDIVVVPEHDYLRGKNVFLTTGAIHHITSARLEEARRASIAKELSPAGQTVVPVLIGGPNGYYSFSKSDVRRFFDKLNILGETHHMRLVFLPSNRTPAELCTELARIFGEKHYVWNREGTNPYLSALSLASHVIVTGDSVSMITEAAATGKPVFVETLTERRRAVRFRRFHESFQQKGITREFTGRLTDWTYRIPNDTPRVAHLIQERIGCHEHAVTRAA